MKKKCFECKEQAQVDHHVIPRSLGGKQTIPLCQECHDLVHGIEPRKISISRLTKNKLSLLKKAGKYYGGRAPKYGYKVASNNNLQRDNFEMKVIRKAKRLRVKGLSYRDIASQLESAGMKNRQGKVFHAQQVKSMVK